MGISGFFVVPHDAVLHRQVLELAVVADSHVRADGAVLDGDVLPDDARGNQPGIVNGIPLVDGGAADIVEFRAFPGQGPGAGSRGIKSRPHANAYINFLSLPRYLQPP